MGEKEDTLQFAEVKITSIQICSIIAGFSSCIDETIENLKINYNGAGHPGSKKVVTHTHTPQKTATKTPM